MNSTLIQTDRFALSETERSAIEHELHHYEDPRAASIEALKIVQKERGWVPDGALYAIGEILGISEKTVRNHLRTIAHKLNTSDRTHAVVLAIGNGWIPIPIEMDSTTESSAQPVPALVNQSQLSRQVIAHQFGSGG